ncbi:MAG: class I SAM-dependent methyltransferase [Candidatus Eremiobacteraeota bacterium]|nr:class I SAM-dependent methyltransferase [Candidatus Eremiobacteraeota bacterium]
MPKVPREEIGAFVAAMPIVYPLERLLRGCSSVLDVGCGDRSPLRFVRTAARKTGFDGYQPSIDLARRRGIHDDYVCAEMERLGDIDRRFDAVMALEVLEHLPKERGVPFLQTLERLAKKIVIISTPNGFLPTPTEEDNPYQQHLSGWEPHELRALGYTVLGSAGIKPLRGEAGRIAKRPAPLWWIASKLSEPLVYSRPEKAFGLIAYKRVNR